MTYDKKRLQAHEVSPDFISSKLRFLADLHLWPRRANLDPNDWLSNFEPDELPYAHNILNVFLYFANPIIDAMFHSAVHSLSSSITRHATSLAEAKAQWQMFLSTVIVTYVQGEKPRPTDSGYVFARKARQVLGISEDQILHPPDALGALVRNPQTAILFVDDFVGSGNQMTATWKRKYSIESIGRKTSFSESAHHNSFVVYLPILATKTGMDTIESCCSGLDVRAVHSLDSRYSLVSDDSILWPEGMRDEAVDVLYHASQRAGIVANYKFGWQGFQSLGLGVAFEHSVPDATLPLIFWNQNGWRPLVRRT